ncbi:MAG: OmpH family outer membrane protein [Cytophagaceae bacterium]|jgi:outer membrane protein|nr:OmpH family outer membrane protein [Cytophagaceae bacterium]
MKRTGFILAIVLGCQVMAFSQKFAFVDTDYILKNIPAYEAAQDQLNQLSKTWQQEIEGVYQEVATLYKEFQAESVFLSGEMRTKKEEAIIEKEKQAKLLQQKYFGAEGEMSKRQQALIQPLQDQITAVLREIAREESLAAIFDKSTGVLYLDPKSDKSDQVLERLGHKKQ